MTKRRRSQIWANVKFVVVNFGVVNSSIGIEGARPLFLFFLTAY